jgi:signal transduction histidine kinase
MKLRTRLVAVTAVTLASGMAVLCLAGNVLFAHTVSADMRQRLGARLNAVVASVQISNGRAQVGGTLNDNVLDSYAWIVAPGGQVIDAPSNPPAGLRTLALSLAASRRARIASGPANLLLGSRPLRTGPDRRLIATVVASFDTSQLDELREEVLLGSIAVALLTLAVGIATTRRALAAVLAPVQQMTHDADEWEAHDLDRRFDLGPPSNEITALAATLDHLLDRIASSRRHEQRFAAEVAHELRTPLAAIRGLAELAAGEEPRRDEAVVDAARLDEAVAALAQIQTQSDRIAATLDTLIAFARRESSPAADGVDLQEIAESFEGVTVRMLSPAIPRVDGDPRLITQTLAPLVDNARRHARSAVTIELDADAGRVLVRVRDDGPGVDPALGADVFLPGVRGAGAPEGGAGLGLPLALRLARSCGGEITIGEGPGGCFVVSLPAR